MSQLTIVKPAPLPMALSARATSMPRVRHGRQLASLVTALLILVGLAASSVVATRAGAQSSARQHLADQQSVLSGAAQYIAPPSTPEATAQVMQIVAAIGGVTTTSPATELVPAMNRLAKIVNGGVAAIYDLKSRTLLARSSRWSPALGDSMLADALSNVAKDGSFHYSQVVATPAGPYTIVSSVVSGWGSAAPRVLATGGPLDDTNVRYAAKFVRSGTLMIIDKNGVVASATDRASLGKRLSWWDQQVKSGGNAERAERVNIDGVDTQLIIKQLPGTTQMLVMRDPAAHFFKASRDSGGRAQFAIILLAGIAGGLLTFGTYRQFRTSRLSESRLNTLLEDTGDVVLVVRDTRITAACGGWNRSQLEDIVGQPLSDAFGGSLALELEVSEEGGKARFDTEITLPDGSQHWVEVTVANRHQDPAVRGLVVSLHDITERRALQRRLHFDATHDSLTGLANRSQFTEFADQAIARHRRDGGSVAIMFLDLDRFKTINDEHGHEAGDAVLIAASARLCSSVRDQDAVARLGGDEFAILLDGATAHEAQTIADRIDASISEPVQLASGVSVGVGASVGIAHAVGGDNDVESLLRHADLMMYAAKEKRHRTLAVSLPATRQSRE